eukprot:gene37154-48548_t
MSETEVGCLRELLEERGRCLAESERTLEASRTSLEAVTREFVSLRSHICELEDVVAIDKEVNRLKVSLSSSEEQRQGIQSLLEAERFRADMINNEKEKIISTSESDLLAMKESYKKLLEKSKEELEVVKTMLQQEKKLRKEDSDHALRIANSTANELQSLRMAYETECVYRKEEADAGTKALMSMEIEIVGLQALLDEANNDKLKALSVVAENKCQCQCVVPMSDVGVVSVVSGRGFVGIELESLKSSSNSNQCQNNVEEEDSTSVSVSNSAKKLEELETELRSVREALEEERRLRREEAEARRRALDNCETELESVRTLLEDEQYSILLNTVQGDNRLSQ